MKWFKKLFHCKWPKLIRFTVRNGDCELLAITHYIADSWDEVMSFGSEFAQTIMAAHPNEENLDEVYWNYEEVN